MEPLYHIEKLDADKPTSTAPLSIGEINVNIWKDTARRAASFPYMPSKKVYHVPHKILPAIYTSTHIEVTPEDTLDAAYRLINKGLNPCVLNFADDYDAGGIVDNGNSAQEESLWRRTNLCSTQLQKFYPLVENVQEGIYSPLVTVFKDTEANGCVDLEKPWSTSFIAVPGLKYPHVNTQQRLNADDVSSLLNKIELIFQTAHANGHDSIILGALGCGAWRSPPRHVAEIFRGLLGIYDGVFKHITFACLTRGPARNDSNYSIFR